MRLAKRIIELMPEHRTYVEPFGGGAAVLFAKPSSAIEVYNDLDGGLVNFFRVLRSRRQFGRLRFLVELTPYSREEYYRFVKTWERASSKVRQAYEWYVIARMSFSGIFGSSWKYSVDGSTGGMSKQVRAWLGVLETLPEAHARLRMVQVEHRDFRDLLAKYDRPATFFYCDPPYVMGTRSCEAYRCELSDGDHEDLTRLLLGLKGKAILSGYRHAVHEPLEDAGWKRIDIGTWCRINQAKDKGKDGQKHYKPESDRRVESLWISPNAQPEST